MRQQGWLIGSVTAVLALVSCAGGTSVESTWKDPTAVGPRKNILVVGIAENEGARRIFEDSFVDILKKRGDSASQSYPMVTHGGEANKDQVSALLKEKGFDSILTARAVSIDKETTYVPGTSYYTPAPYYYSYWNYYSPASMAVSSPGYYQEDTYVRVESNLYDADGKLLFSAGTSTLKTGNMHESIGGFVDVLVGEMQKAGLIN